VVVEVQVHQLILLVVEVVLEVRVEMLLLVVVVQVV
tara:strand:+ start:281 stop:388 length:108 start_codon:yes stop_codon:yes gene_type:complete